MYCTPARYYYIVKTAYNLHTKKYERSVSEIDIINSKQIYRTYQNNFSYTNWLNKKGEIAESEGDVSWRLCGIKEDFNSEVVSQAINNTFPEDEVYSNIYTEKMDLVNIYNLYE